LSSKCNYIARFIPLLCMNCAILMRHLPFKQQIMQPTELDGQTGCIPMLVTLNNETAIQCQKIEHKALFASNMTENTIMCTQYKIALQFITHVCVCDSECSRYLILKTHLNHTKLNWSDISVPNRHLSYLSEQHSLNKLKQ